MTQNRRIVLNIAATFGRSLYVVVIGLLCGRWALNALGEIDYGLYGVIGGLTAFVRFFFDILSGSVGRFFALSLGRGSIMKDGAIEECRRWFSLAILIHCAVPFLLTLIFYPIGIWAIHNFLRIPTERIGDCLIVFNFVCISCLVSMMTVPFNAMYSAKQYIAELTVYSFVTVSLNVVFLYYMISHPGVWLVKYSVWTCLISIVPQVIISIRAVSLFPECRFRWRYAWDKSRYMSMLTYTGWNTIGSLAYVLRGQGVNVLVNKFFGPAVNASMSIANTVSNNAMSLARSMQGAFYPVITAAVGAKDYETARRITFRFCKLDLVLALIFVLPLSVELPYVITIWLKNPPEYAIGLCQLVLLYAFLDKHSLGHAAIVAAEGRIKWYQIILGMFSLSTLPLAWIFCYMGCNVYFVGWALVISWGCVAAGRVVFAKCLLDMSIKYWLRRIIVPVYFVALIAGGVGLVPHIFMMQSFPRLIISVTLCELVFFVLTWLVVLDSEERGFLSSRIQKYLIHK